jgi:anti-sigma B factor antagonist
MLNTEDRIGEVVVLRVEERRLDAANAPSFKQELNREIDQGATQIVLDLRGVEFVDSSGLGALVSCLKRLGPLGGVAIAGAGDAVQRLFTLTRMDRVFSLHPTVEEAVRRLSS